MPLVWNLSLDQFWQEDARFFPAEIAGAALRVTLVRDSTP